MRRASNSIMVVVVAFLALSPVRRFPQTAGDEELLRTRERVWRAWFAGDIRTLKDLVPPETIVMSGGEKEWKRQSDVLKSSGEFHSKGGKLLRLEFPRTEVQHFGNVAVVWSSYTLETEMDGKISLASSRVTEIFVWKQGRWTNPGWHTDEEK
jgi:hypothetical protein